MRDAVLLAGLFAVALFLSFVAAEYGHPTSVWLWRDMLHFSP